MGLQYIKEQHKLEYNIIYLVALESGIRVQFLWPVAVLAPVLVIDIGCELGALYHRHPAISVWSWFIHPREMVFRELPNSFIHWPVNEKETVYKYVTTDHWPIFGEFSKCFHKRQK